MITHDEARIEAVSYNCESIRVLLKYITQQEKQERLLELYKELNFIYEQLYTIELSELVENQDYYQNKITELKQKIKELENE